MVVITPLNGILAFGRCGDLTMGYIHTESLFPIRGLTADVATALAAAMPFKLCSSSDAAPSNSLFLILTLL